MGVGLTAGGIVRAASTSVSAATATTTYRQDVLSDSPRAYWRLNEATGTTAADELGGNPGTYSGVLLNQPGSLASEVETSVSFDGVQSFTRVPASSSLDMTTAVTVEFWAKRRTISGTYQVIVGKPGDGISQNENYAVWLTNTNKYQAYFGNGTTYATVQTPAITDTNWHYVVATDDGSSVKIYLDGVLKQSVATTLRLTANTKPLNIGRANSNQYFFNGWVDEVAIYPTALAATRIQAHYTKGTTDLVLPVVSLATPAANSALAAAAVTFSGVAGAAPGDSSIVSVKVYSGTSAAGTPAQTLSAIRQSDNSYSVSTNLADGTWTAQAEQLDSAGNLGQSSANTFTVATVPPVPTIGSGPANPTDQTSASFNFSADKAASFKCGLDGAGLTPCSSPQTYSGLADGDHTFQLTATDAAGNTGATSYAWTVDTVPPATPTITSSPPSQTSSTSASLTFSDTEAGVTLLCQLDDADFSACTSPQSYSGLASGVHTFAVKALDPAGNESGTASSTWTIGSAAPPPPTFDSEPPSPSSSTSAIFIFSDSQAGLSFVCSLDGAADTSCTSPTAISGLTDGAHTFRVSADDGAGNTSSAQSYTWTVDTTAPSETIDSAPPRQSGSTNASFSFSASDTDAVSFECSLDGAPWADCTSPTAYSGLAEGSHTFAVEGTDSAGNTSSVSYTWTVDTVAPTTTISSHPPNPSNSSNASFSFTADEPSTFACSLDGTNFTTCTSSQAYSGLANGSHSFRVRATDQTGNLGQAASYGWTITTGPPPAPTIVSAPSSPTNSTSASFSFSDSQSGVTFLCQLDGGGFSICTSPRVQSGLADGSHTFAVEARDGAGNLSAPTTYTWTVDTAPPTITIASTPPNPSNQSTATFGFFASEQASLECKLDAGAFASCTSPQVYAGLADGSHTVQARGTDSAGNVSGPATYQWTVDTAAPTITLTSPANGDSRAEWPTFTGVAGAASGDSSSVTVAVYSGSAASGTPIQTSTGAAATDGTYAVPASVPLNPGTYTAQARQSDSAGNTGSSAANTFTVGDPVILAAGSIASCLSDGAGRTANLLSSTPDALVMPLGNNAYENGQPSEYANCYDPTWGVAKGRTRPVVGQHDENVVSGGPPAGTGYVNYFANQLAPLGASASDLTKLYYSYDLGAWHIVVLNDLCMDHTTPNCDESAQEQWLKNDLATHSNMCVLAAYNRPLFSSDSIFGNRLFIEPLWNYFYQYGVDLVLNGATHHYERFAPQDPDGVFDPTYGVREIISAHGGNANSPAGTLQDNSQVYDSTSFGVLKVTLHATSYDWQYLPVADGLDTGGSFTDSGSSSCHAPPAASAIPYRDQVLAGLPTSYWRFDETSGTTATDEIGVNPGTYSNVLLGQPGALTSDTNPSASFDGVKSYVSVPESSSLDMTNAVTVEFWAKRRTISNKFQVIVGKPGDGISKNENYAVWLTSGNKYQAYFGDGSTYATVQTPAITDTNWHYVVATDDGSTVKIYLDGVLKQSAATTVKLTANTKPLNIGRAYNNQYFFNGWLDEVAIYPTALSGVTVLSHFNAR